jgi:hypothetical protein
MERETNPVPVVVVSALALVALAAVVVFSLGLDLLEAAGLLGMAIVGVVLYVVLGESKF